MAENVRCREVGDILGDFAAVQSFQKGRGADDAVAGKVQKNYAVFILSISGELMKSRVLSIRGI